jgi:hypothetical protein
MAHDNPKKWQELIRNEKPRFTKPIEHSTRKKIRLYFM